ncbi:MAG: ABC transporter ATP-binding protein [Oscillospiraceae bacterium]|nr:ABC transporter ATP-binding protein [Oscillospiraceae bacterium]
MKQKTTEKATLAWLVSVAKGKKRYVILLTLINVIMGTSSVGYAVFLKLLVNNAIAGDQAGFGRNAALLIGLVIIQFILRSASRFLDEYCSASLENNLKQRLFQNLLKKDYATVTAIHSGEWMNRMTSDTSVIASGMTHILPGLAGTVSRMVSSLVLLVSMVPAFGVIFVAGGVAVVLFTWALRRLMKKLHMQVREADGRLRVFLSERLSSLMVIRAFGVEGSTVEQGDSRMAEHKTIRMKKNRLSNIFHNGFSVAMNCGYVFGAVYCGYMILLGQMDYGTFTAVLQAVSQTNAPIASVSGFFPQYSAMIASAERLYEVENYPDEVREQPVEDAGTYYQEKLVSLQLKKACFTYLPVGDADAEKEGRRTVLKRMDMEIRKGEYVAFCGPSGCGKSTVLKLLMCMYNLDAGERVLVGTDGEQPLTAGWRSLFSYVPQGNQLMTGTIREVVTFGNETDMAREEDIRRALNIACAGFIEELPEGLETQLGERGAGLSEGQMQRIAIARAIFSDRPILLLDEATSALDEATEAQVLENLRAMTDKTVIIVTHRPAALDITDKIIHFNPDEE